MNRLLSKTKLVHYLLAGYAILLFCSQLVFLITNCKIQLHGNCDAVAEIVCNFSISDWLINYEGGFVRRGWKNRSMLLHHLSWTKCRKSMKSRILLTLIIKLLQLMIVLLVSKNRSMLLHSLPNSPIMLLESEHAVTLSGRQYSVHCP